MSALADDLLRMTTDTLAYDLVERLRQEDYETIRHYHKVISHLRIATSNAASLATLLEQDISEIGTPPLRDWLNQGLKDAKTALQENKES